MDLQNYIGLPIDFVKNELSIELLKEAMLLGKLGLQYVLISKKGFNNIKYVSSEKIEQNKEYETIRTKALYEYNDLKNKDNYNNTFIRDIMRERHD